MSTGEPQWLPDDLELALEWQREDQLRCKTCGHHLDETLADDAFNKYEAGEMTCHGCQVIEWRRTTLSEEERDMAGMSIYAIRKGSAG
jgi:hypothetical protein